MQQTIFTDNRTGATFSHCRRYRYALWRIWGESKPLVMIVGLNPSTANESQPDPTIRRVITFAKSWGYGGFYMMNLFAYVSAYPKDLVTVPDAIGDNDRYLDEVSKKCQDVVFAWGDFKVARWRSAQVIAKFPDAKCILKNANGTPGHPLYIKADAKLISF